MGNHRGGSSTNGLLQAGEWFDDRFQNFAPHFNGRLKIKILKDGVVDGGTSVSNATDSLQLRWLLFQMRRAGQSDPLYTKLETISFGSAERYYLSSKRQNITCFH